METVQTIQNQIAEKEPQSEFDATIERILSATVEKILHVVQSIKEPYQRQALERALKSIEPENPSKQGQGEQILTRGIEEANPAEKIIVNWLMKQSYSTKLACYIMSIWHIGDHGTDNIVNEIIGQWETEILDNAMSLIDNLKPDEVLMTGVSAELAVWEENY